MKEIIDFITGFVEITGNPVVNYIILAVVGLVSFLVAFGLVGIIFDTLGFYDSDLMSGCHWIIRLIVFLGLSFISICVIKFFTWLISFEWWVYLIAFAVIVSAIVIVAIVKHRISAKKFVAPISCENIDQITEQKEKFKPIIDKDHCPRCGGLLVKRYGPFGEFYGCSNYAKQNCTYTRKFK